LEATTLPIVPPQPLPIFVYFNSFDRRTKGSKLTVKLLQKTSQCSIEDWGRL